MVVRAAMASAASTIAVGAPAPAVRAHLPPAAAMHLAQPAVHHAPGANHIVGAAGLGLSHSPPVTAAPVAELPALALAAEDSSERCRQRTFNILSNWDSFR